MPYITVMQTPPTKQVTWEDVFLNLEGVPIECKKKYDLTGTITRKYSNVKKGAYATSINGLINALESFEKTHNELIEKERPALYNTFYIPKASGGLRRIDAPCDELKAALYELKAIFENKFHALYHTSAFAYIKHRSAIDAVKRHQRNGSRWFLKTDFSNFFGSLTEEFLISMLREIFPFSEVCKSERGLASLKKCISLCMLNGGLPQGTPISPLLTNIVMIPIDHRLYNELQKKQFVYTRYADDILISQKYDFNMDKMVAYINSVIQEFHAPFTIKKEKTRYGSSSGSNWNLGVMLNKDNQITIGYQRKKQFKAMCCGYINSSQQGHPWEFDDIRHFRGLISYYMMVEKEEICRIIDKFNEKYHVNMILMIEKDLSKINVGARNGHEMQ